MKKQFKGIISLAESLVLLMALCLSALAEGAGPVVYRSGQTLARGLECINEVAWHDSARREESWTLQFTAGGDVRLASAWGDGLKKGDTLTTAAEFAEDGGVNVLAGFNTDFFDTTSGGPMGLVVSGGTLYSSDGGENAIGFTADGRTVIGKPGMRIELRNIGTPEGFAGEPLEIGHYNKQPYEWDLNLLSRDYAASLFLAGTWLVAELDILSGSPVLGGTLELQVAELFTITDENYELPETRLVLLAQAGGYAAWKFGFLVAGELYALDFLVEDQRFLDVTEACGGGDILLWDGEFFGEEYWDEAIAGRNPRTAAGVMSDGTVLFTVIDGRNSAHSNGLSLRELAEEMRKKGCVSAINLDGGGSSVIATQQIGESGVTVRNKPSDGFLRSCATYLLLVTDIPSDGVPVHLALEGDGALLAYYTAFPLGEIRAADAGYEPAQPPEDVSVTVLSGPGFVEDGFFYAGDTGGGARLLLHSDSTGAEGYATVHVLPVISTLELSPVLVGEGESVWLGPKAGYYGREVISSPGSYTYSYTGNFGGVSPEGLLTAEPLSAGKTGYVTAFYGPVSATAQVRVICRFSDMEGHWAAQAVDALSRAEVVNGDITEAGRLYRPEAAVSRQELWVMLARLRGIDTAEYRETEMPFADLESVADWAADSLRALHALGVVAGAAEDGGLYARPDSPVSRQEVCAFLARAYGLQGEGGASIYERFPDGIEASGWALDAIEALTGLGILSGFEDGTLRPASGATRAQMAAMLSRFL